jgi:hypothetical protein
MRPRLDRLCDHGCNDGPSLGKPAILVPKHETYAAKAFDECESADGSKLRIFAQHVGQPVVRNSTAEMVDARWQRWAQQGRRRAQGARQGPGNQGGFRYFSAWAERIRTSRRRFVKQPSPEKGTHNVSGLHANSAGISVRWTNAIWRFESSQPSQAVQSLRCCFSAVFQFPFPMRGKSKLAANWDALIQYGLSRPPAR